MIFFCFFSISLSIDIYLNTTSSNHDNECLEKTGCSINALMEYFEDTNGDTLHILGNIDKSEDVFRLLTWISMKSYSEFTIIGSPSYLNMLSMKSNQQYKIILNESIITFENIFFYNISSPLLLANQGIVTLKNMRFENTQENDDNIIKIESSTCYFSNLSIHKANIYHHSFFFLIETKAQINSISIFNFSLLSSDSYLFCFQRKCQVEINYINFFRSQSINTAIQVSDSFLSIKKIFIQNVNITLAIFQNSDSNVDELNVFDSDFSFGKTINSIFFLRNFRFANSTSTKIIFEPEHSIFNFTNHNYTNSMVPSIIRTNGTLNSTVIFNNCFFSSVIGTASIFVFVNSDVKINSLNIKNLFIPNYCNLFNGKNTSTNVISSVFENIYSIGQSSFAFSIKDSYFRIDNSLIFKIETQFLTVFLGSWEINNCNFVQCQCYVPSNQFLMTVIEASNFESGLLTNTLFNKCKVFLSLIYCFQGKEIVVDNSTFTECLGTKSSSISCMNCDILIKDSNFIKNQNPFPSGVAIFISCNITFDNCSFIHFPSSPVPVLRILNPSNFTLSSVSVINYQVFCILFHVQVPIYILNCVFENSFSDAFYISDFNEKVIFDRVNFSKISMSFENEIKKSQNNFESFNKKENKILKNENYFKTHEDHAFSQTRYLEYMRNLEPLSRNSTPFRNLPYINTFPNIDFINDIEQILNSFKKRDQILILLSFFIMILITIRFFFVEFLCRLIKKIYSKIRKNDDQNLQNLKQIEQPKLQLEIKNQLKNQKNKKKKKLN